MYNNMYENSLLTITELFNVDSVSNVQVELHLSLANKIPPN